MRVLILLALVFNATSLLAQAWVPWQVQTPRERHDVTGKGETVAFPQVDLPAGMVYRVHTEERVDVGDGGIADARYYIKIIPVAPTVIPVSLKIRYDVAAEDWFNSGVAPAQQGGYQSNHVYDAVVTSRGVPLAFHFFDRENPPSSNGYYDDNNGRIIVEVSRETPGIAVKLDTIDFGTVAVGTSKTLLDSIQGYGKGYQLENVFISPGPGSTAFSTVSERTVPFGIKDTTNEFQFTFTPNATVPYIAYFHLISSGAFGGDQDRIIVLIGNGGGARVTALTDTLDFGMIAPGTTKTLAEVFANSGNVATTVRSVQMAPPTAPFTTAGVPIQLDPSTQAPLQVTFAPTAIGSYFAGFDALLTNGTSVRFYAKGLAGQGRPFFSRDTLFFDTVIIGLSQVLTTQFTNKEDIPGTGGPLFVTTSTNSNPEFTVIGNPGPVTYPANSGEIYTVVFAPTVHYPNYGMHSGIFTLFFSDQGPKSVYFFGYDHQALEAILAIDSSYYVTPGKEIVVKQYLKSDLSGTLDPVRQLSESITYDPTYFDLVGVERGAIISSAEWNFTPTLTAGKVDISVNTTTSRFSAGGELLKMRFRAKPDAPIGAYSYLPQMADFGGIIEPLTSSRRGKITIADICTPVRLTTGIGTSVEQNSPNPFNPSTRIKYQVGESSPEQMQHVSIRLFDVTGRLVKVLLDEMKAPGIYELRFNASEFPSGVYAYTFKAGDYSKTLKMVLSK